MGKIQNQSWVVSVSGEIPIDRANIIMDAVSYGIGDDVYDVMINDEQFKEALKKEWKGGNISDDKIKSLAKDAGADFLCFAKINSAKGLKGKQMLVHLIDLGNPKVNVKRPGMTTIKSDEFDDLDHMIDIFLKAVADMLGVSAPKSAGGGDANTNAKVSSVSEQANSLAYEGKTYKTVKMPDGKVWMAENMNEAAGKSACYQNSEFQCRKCGRLYDWETATEICPNGWHLPSDAEWTALGNAVDGGSSTVGMALKSKSGWNSSGNGMDKHGFSALPCGVGFSDGSFGYAGYYAYFWSAAEYDAYYAWDRYLNAGYADMRRYNDNKTRMFSVRCVRD